jgi:signal peptidase I
MSSRARTPVRRRLVGVVLSATAVWWGLRVASALLREVSGDSMLPTLAAGDLILVLPERRTLRPGTIVVVADPRDPGRETVKRIAAAPGQPADLGGEVIPVPAGHVAVAGDAPLRSTDSRQFGAVPDRLITGRAVARLWPRPRLLT